jgi:hypothetical protein
MTKAKKITQTRQEMFTADPKKKLSASLPDAVSPKGLVWIEGGYL